MYGVYAYAGVELGHSCNAHGESALSADFRGSWERYLCQSLSHEVAGFVMVGATMLGSNVGH